MDFQGFILIGGKSSRMGKDKFALILNNKSFLQIATETLINSNVERVSVVVSAQNSVNEHLPVFTDIYPNRGALSGIHSALMHSESDFTIILACDYPFVTVALIEFLQNLTISDGESDAYVPIQSDDKIQPLCAIYKTEICREILSKMLANESENYSVRDFLNQINTRFIKFDEITRLPNAEYFFFNVNTPDDFDLATKIHEKNTKGNLVEIVQMSIDDLEEVLRIQQESNLSPWSYEGYANELVKENSFTIVARSENQIVGFLVASLFIEDSCAELYNIGVDSKHRRKGIGENLLGSLIKHCIASKTQKILLEVRESNQAAIDLYAKNGFIDLTTRKNFYTNPIEDAKLMVKEL